MPRSASPRRAGAEGDAADSLPRRLRVITGATAVLLALLAAGVGYQQLFHSRSHTDRAERQSHRRVILPAPRGTIYDREHRVLAADETRAAAVINLGELRGEFRREQEATGFTAARARLIVAQRHLDRLNALTGRREKVDAARLERAYAHERLQPFVLATDLTGAEAAQLNSLAPVRISRLNRRWYPHGATAAHVLGRVRRDGEAISGIEEQHAATLQGRPGETLIRVDALGFPFADAVTTRPPAPGQDVVLSLDLDLQLAAERALSATPEAPRGAVAVIAVDTGEILALASKPGYDLNAVAPTLSIALKEKIDTEGGWLNRATQGLYPPGSTFKIFTALAGLRAGTLRPDTTLDCPGYHDVAGRRFRCHHPDGHGRLRLGEALARSCNVFAYQAGLAAGPAALAAEVRRFHFDEPTGIDLPAETQRMLAPDPAWKEQTGRGPWTPGDTANLAIGQGFLRLSPLQMACAVASLARRETLTVPTLLRQPGRRPSGDRPPETLDLSDSDYAALLAGLRAVVEIGIGSDAQVPGVRIAGKTGTAQIERPEGRFNVAWFVAFAPAEQPALAIAVALEGGQPDVEFAGARHAAPIVQEVIGAWFDKQPPRNSFGSSASTP